MLVGCLVFSICFLGKKENVCVFKDRILCVEASGGRLVGWKDMML